MTTIRALFPKLVPPFPKFLHLLLFSVTVTLDHVCTMQLDAVPKRFYFCYGQASYSYYSDAIRIKNGSNSTPFKKVEQSDCGIHFAKCEQHETEQGSGKN